MIRTYEAFISDTDNDYEHDDIVDRIIPAFEIIKRQNLIKDPDNPKPFKDHMGVIEFKNVSFSYDQGKKHRTVLKDFSLVIPDGQKVGVVGISGAGKSKKHSTFIDPFKCFMIQIAISNHCIFNCANMFSECGRVKNNYVINVFRIL